MSLKSVHPKYAAALSEWELMRDAFNGEKAVKAKGSVYLKPTQSMDERDLSPGKKGDLQYQAYKERARFPEYVEDAVENLVGAMHGGEAVIKVPPALEPMLKTASAKGESIHLLLRRINAEQLITGRIGLLLDWPESVTDGVADVPFIATYAAERVTNWNEGTISDPNLQNAKLIILDESEDVMAEDFSYVRKEKYRVLSIGDPTKTAEENENADYMQGLFIENASFDNSQMKAPSHKSTSLKQIPFVVCNQTDLQLEPQKPPLIGLARICFGIYRQTADYYLNIHLQSQDTFVTVGAVQGEPGAEAPDWSLGAGNSVNLPLGGSAAFVGVSADGLGGQQKAIDDDRKEAKAMAGEMLDTTSRQKESGDALTQRVAAQTVTLKQIAKTSAEALKKILQQAAVWVNADPELVIVEPNLDFAESTLTPAEFVQLMSAINAGLPIPQEELYKLVQKAGYSAQEFVDAMAKIEKEQNEKQAKVLANAEAIAKINADNSGGKPAPAGGAPKPA